MTLLSLQDYELIIAALHNYIHLLEEIDDKEKIDQTMQLLAWVRLKRSTLETLRELSTKSPTGLPGSVY
jgi:hypothetical protein